MYQEIKLNQFCGKRSFACVITPDEFDKRVDALMDILEDTLDDDSLPTDDLEYSSGVMSLVLKDKGVWIINKHSASGQVWLSSPVSGPSKFDYVPEKEKWISEREDKRELYELLDTELSEAIGRPIGFVEEF
eukprot:CAMPEP_0167744644 /NCGR_PEP_ID=MMETSP0110_2-20121227/2706_1 /TAXON_ID=629695 /ORGANISM="Gymnochlora sp., Strain CCMP2014" /LENGTH=131 /DNA_ID=CAMNT_0007629189 /DNA_START=90 /DNA_END=485 /DNA_ORIENTATION=+